MPGPAPDPNALRRDRKDDASWLTLSAAGRSGDAPAWPLPDETERESAVWVRLWSLPQALLWEQNRQELEVALYVRMLVEAEAHDAPVTGRMLVGRMADSLLLTIPAMFKARVKIEAVAAASSEVEPAANVSSIDALRARRVSAG